MSNNLVQSKKGLTISYLHLQQRLNNLYFPNIRLKPKKKPLNLLNNLIQSKGKSEVFERGKWTLEQKKDIFNEYSLKSIFVAKLVVVLNF